MSAITVGGDLVHYEVLGRGRPVILMHGWLGSWRYWIPAMRLLQLKYRVYALDLFGFGDSGKNPEKYTISHQVNLLDEFMRQLGIPKAAMIGHGLGAQIMAQFGSQNQERVARLLITNAPLFDPGDLGSRPMPGRKVALTRADDTNPLATTRKLIEQAEAEFNSSTAETLKRRPAGLDEALSAASAPTVPSGSNQTITDPAKMIDRESLKQMALARGEAAVRGEDIRPSHANGDNPLKDRIGSQSLDALLARCFRRNEPEYEKLHADLGKMDDAVVRRITLSFDSGKMLDTLRQLSMPTMILHGTDDPLIEAPNDAVWNYLTLERDDLVLPLPLPGVRHFPMLEYEPFMRLVNDFLEVPDITKIEVKGINRWRRRSR
ncbi:MAG: alpha/beta hydrolase [bacterium]|nr:alpha/beta hydrolase [bacterium]